jgi:hypothetical protein
MDSKKTKAVAVIAAVAMIIAAVGIYAVMSSGGGSPEGSRVGTQLSASELPDADSRLWVYGNANEDDRIDDSDIAYLNGIVSGSVEATELADANCDGRVDQKDLEHLEKMISSEDMRVYYVDNYDTVASVSWPVESIAIGHCSGAYCADLIGVADKVTMVDNTIADYWTALNTNFAEASSYGGTGEPDYEAMMLKGIDVYVVGYCVAGTDEESLSKLNPAGIDVMFLTTCDNSGIDRPNENIDRTIITMAYLLQGDMIKTYDYLAWHDSIIVTLASAVAGTEQDSAYLMGRSSPTDLNADISITGYNNTNNLHAEWVGVYSIGMHEAGLSKNYQTISMESIMTYFEQYQNSGYEVFYMDNCHAGLRQQYDLQANMALDAQRFAGMADPPTILGMAREAGNSPLYVIELAFMQNVMYPELTLVTGVDYAELFEYYFENFASEDYYDLLDLDQFFSVYVA